MKRYCYTDEQDDFKGPYSLGDLQKLKELRIIGDPTKVLDETTRKWTTLGELLGGASGPVVFPVTPASAEAKSSDVGKTISQRNCPACGAKITSVVANCEYCGVEIAKCLEGKITPQEMIAALTKRIQETPGWWGLNATQQKKAGIIGDFVVPSDIGLLAEFFLFCHGKAPTNTLIMFMSGDAIIKEAWQAKARSAYERLRLASLNNPQLTQFIAPFDSIYGVQSGKAKGVLGGILGKIFGR